MADPSTSDRVTQLLGECAAGDPSSADRLLPLVYEELRKLASVHMAREAPGATLQPTALVHDAYLRLVDSSVEWDGRGHFFAAAAEAMRRILVDQARRRATKKRGGDHVRVDLDVDHAPAAPHTGDDEPAFQLQNATSDQILAVHAALSRMEERDDRMAEVVKLRFFAGLTVEETARAMGVSDRTVRREWTFAKAWLARELRNI